MKELRSLDSLAAMLATRRAGSPSKAARALGWAPSSVYRAIERLEKDVGAPLFERSISGWTPTEAGDKILQLGENIEQQIAETELSLLRGSRLSPVPLRVSASDGFATYLAPLLAAFAERQRHIAIDLVVENKVVDLVRRQADVAVRPDMRPGDGLVGQRAGKLAHALYGPADLIERQGMPASAEDLGRFRLCSLTPALPHFTASNWWKGRDHGAVVSFVANTETALAAAIAGGAGLGVLPRFIGDRLDAVRRIPTIDIGDPVDIWLITHPTLSENAVVRSLIRALAAAIRKDARLFAGSNK
jgi:DNA-binding transcriptional LysR family regulator